MNVAIVGQGVVGARAAQVLRDIDITCNVVKDADHTGSCDVAILARGGEQHDDAETLIGRGVSVVTTADEPDEIEELIELDEDARKEGVALVVGATAVPGLSGLLARHLAAQFDSADEIHVAVHGTGGPACARRHHKTLRGFATGLQDGEWIKRPAGSGRELCWFPEPIGARDCYRADLAEPMLLHRVFPEVQRISARRAATRRDRLTATLPMLFPPHAEGGIGGVRVEVRGVRDGARTVEVLGVAERLATVAGVVSAVFAVSLGQGLIKQEGVIIAGMEALPTSTLVRMVMDSGIKIHAFTGITD